MDITRELIRLFGLKSDAEIVQGNELFGKDGTLSFRRPATILMESEAPLHIFIKSSDLTRTEMEELAQQLSGQFCRRECVFYGFVGPVLERIMSQYQIEPVFPRAFGQKINDKGTILVMEDVKKQGFRLVEPKLFGIEHAYCVVRALARLQAAFWIARVNFNYSLDSVLFGRESPFIECIKNSGFDFKPIVALSSKYFFENLGKHAKTPEDAVLIQGYVAKFMSALIEDPKKGMPSLNADEPLGISHSDIWFTNLMFKGDGDDLICRLFDWQFWDIGIFGFDLGQLMLTSLSLEDMQEHVDKIPKEFYRTFKEIYEAKTGNPALFSEEAALGNMGKSLFYATYWVIRSSFLLWERDEIDASSTLAKIAFIIRTDRIKVPF